MLSMKTTAVLGYYISLDLNATREMLIYSASSTAALDYYLPYLHATLYKPLKAAFLLLDAAAAIVTTEPFKEDEMKQQASVETKKKV